MHPEVVKAIDKCTEQCRVCRRNQAGQPTSEDCSRLRCPPQQQVLKIAKIYGERI